MDDLAILGGPAVLTAEQHGRWPVVTNDDRQAVLEVLNRGIISGARSPEISALEAEWATYVDARYCIAVNSGTAALHCCAAAADVEPGAEVIVPALTFIATAMAMVHQGAIPVFCDIDRDTYNLATDRLPDLITERTRAIVPVHLHGLPSDMDAVRAVANKYGLAVIEDAAQAHGATFQGRRVGTLGDTSAFSMNATKGLPGGEGGLFVTDDEESYRAARRLTMFGEDVPTLAAGEFRAYWSEGLGYNYRNQELPSALTRSQLRRLDTYNSTARRNAEFLTRGLAEVRGLAAPRVPPDRTSVYHKYRVRIDAAELGFDGPVSELRDRIIRALRAEGAEVVVWQVYPLPALPVFRRAMQTWHPRHSDAPLRDWDPEEYPVASRALDETFVLGSETMPLYVQDEEVMQLYLEAIHKVMGNLDAIVDLPHEPLTFGWIEGAA